MLSRRVPRSLTMGLLIMLALVLAASFPLNTYTTRTASAQQSEGLIQVTMADLISGNFALAGVQSPDGSDNAVAEAPYYDIREQRGDLPNHNNVNAASAVPQPSALDGGTDAPFTTGAVFTSVNLAFYSSQGYGNVPPDTMGAVGPTQFITLVNGRWRVHNKETGAVQFDLSLDNFFQPVRNPAASGSGAFDPRVRYDRESDRWFHLAINRETPNNRIFLAVSDSGTISGATIWKYYYYYAPSTINGGFDNTCFVDYIMMGIDTNAVYFGANVFLNGNNTCGSMATYGQSSSTSMWVVPKDLMLSSPVSDISSITTAFTDLLFGLDPNYGLWTPMPADNYDPVANTGYGIGQDAFSDNGLVLIRINNPGGAPGTQTLSTARFVGRDKNDGNLAGVPRPDVPSPTQGAPITNWGLDPLSWRPIGGAHVRDGSIWFSYSNSTNISGAAILYPAFGDRFSARWYEVTNLNATPTIVQDADVYDSVNVSNPLHYWMPNIAVNGQGHAVIGFSASSATTTYPSGAYANRLATDPPNFMNTPVIYQPGQGAYARQSFETSNRLTRWGDYSMTTVDPCDDMTFYTIQQFADTPTAMSWGAGGNWGVSVAEIKAPPPPPFTLSADTNPINVGAVTVTLQGTITSGQGFYDTVSPEAMSSACRVPLDVNVTDVNSNPLAVSNINWIDADTVEVTFSTVGAAVGQCTVEVINPDGQSVNSTTCQLADYAPVITDQPDSQTIASGTTATLNVAATGAATLAYQWYQGNSGDTSIPVGTNSTSYTTPALIATTSYWVRVSNTYGSADSNTATITVNPPVACDTDTPGIYRDSDFSWYLRYSNTSGFAETIFNYGLPSDVSIIGDWDGDGFDTVGIYRDNTFYLKNDNSGGLADLTFAFGAPGDIPVAGDWNGDGTDTIGVYRPSSAVWFLRNSNSSGDPDFGFAYGLPNETPVIGDWNGDNIDTVGIYRDSDFSWYLRNTNSDGFADVVLSYGLPSDDAVVGDWNGDCVDTVGIYRSNEANWYLKNTNTSGIADVTFTFGLPNERGVVGHWMPAGGGAPEVVAAEPVEEPAPEVAEEPTEEVVEEPIVEPLLVTVEAGDAAVAAFGGWTSYASDAASGGSYLYSSGAASDALTLAFDGSYAELTVVNHPSLGNLVVEVDGVVVTTVNLAGETALGVSVVVGELPAGLHTLRLYPEAEGMVIAVDTFAVAGTVIAPVVVVPDPTEVVPTETEAPAPTDVPAPTETPDPATPVPTETPAPVLLPVLENFDEVSDWEFTGNWQPQVDCGYAGACVFVPTGLRDTVSSMTYGYAVDLTSVPLGWQVQWTLWQNATLSIADSVAYEVSTDGGASWQLVGFISDVNVVWEPLALDLSGYIGQVVNLRISVNTLVALPENTVTVGYWLDEMQLTAFEPLPEPLPTEETPVPTEETPVPVEETPIPPEVAPTEEAPLPTEAPTEEALPTEEVLAEPAPPTEEAGQ